MRQYLLYDRMDVRNDGLVMGNDVLQDLMDVWWHDLSFPFTVDEPSAVLAEDELHKTAPRGKGSCRLASPVPYHEIVVLAVHIAEQHIRVR
jgi:hypothetical protein